MARPTAIPAWATNLVSQTVEINGQLQAKLNKEEPSAEFKLSGLLYRENLPRPYFNYILDLLSKWVVYLDAKSAVGDVHLTTGSETAQDLSIRLGGTWTDKGTQAIGSITVNVFERIS